MSSRSKRAIFVAISLVIWWVTMFVGTTLPAQYFELKRELWSHDKLIHFAMFFGLSCWLYAYGRLWRQKTRQRSLFWATFLPILYGVIDEYHQLLIRYRTPSIMDFFSDVTGTLFAVSCIVLLILSRGKSFDTHA